MGGEAGLMSAFLNQLKQMGVFDKIQGLILGTFTKMQESNISPTIEELVVKIINNPNLPIAKTEEIGHGANSKCIVIGENITALESVFMNDSGGARIVGETVLIIMRSP